MKLKADRQEFSNVVSMVATATSKRTSTIPLYNNLLFEVNKDSCVITGTDGESQVTARVKVDSKDEFAFCVPKELVAGTLRTLDSDEIGIVKREHDSGGHSINLMVGRKKHYNIVGDNYEAFSKLDVEGEKSFSVNADSMINALSSAASACDPSDLRAFMMNVILKLEKDVIKIIGFSNHISTKQIIDIVDNDDPIGRDVMVTKATCDCFCSIPFKGSMDVYITDKNIKLVCSGIEFVSRVVDGRMPNQIDTIWNTCPEEYFIVDTQSLKRSMQIVRLYGMEGAAYFIVKEGKLFLMSETKEIGHRADESINAENHGVEDTEVHFNSMFLISSLSKMNYDKVRLFLKGPRINGKITPVDNENELWMFAPIAFSS